MHGAHTQPHRGGTCRTSAQLARRVRQLERELERAQLAAAMCEVYQRRNAELAEHNNQLRAALRYATQRKDNHREQQ